MAWFRLSNRHGVSACIFTVMLVFSSFVTAADVAPTSNPDSAISGSVVPAEPPKKSFFEKVGDRLASLDIRAKIKILDTDLVKGLRAAINYKYELEPSYDGEYHLRMDRGTLGFNANLGELIDRANKYVGLSLTHETQILYARPFKSHSDAFTAAPFGYAGVPRSKKEILARLPFTTETILRHFQPGEFFSFNAHMNVVVNASTLPLQYLKTPATIFTHYLVSGEFQIHLVKVDDHTIELKLIAVRRKETGFGFVAGLDSGHRIFGLRVLDRRIEKLTNITEIVKLSSSDATVNLNMAHYLLDLNDPRVVRAYEGLTASLFKIKTLQITRPDNSSAELTDMLISDITPLETIYASERARPVEKRVVDRIFLGKNDIDVASNSLLKFAPIIMKFTKETEYYENILTVTNADASLNYYRLHTFQRTNSINWWFSYYKGVSVSRASLALDSDQAHSYGALGDIAFEWNYRDKSLTRNELVMIKSATKQLVPPSVHRTIKWGAFENETEYSNARFIYKLNVHPEALGLIARLGQPVKGLKYPVLAEGSIFGLLSKYVLSVPAPAAEVQDPFSDGTEKLSKYYTIVDKYQASLLNISHYLERVFNGNLTNKERSDAFAELRFNSLFIEIGPGFLLSLLPPEQILKYANFEISMTADDVEPMKPVMIGTVTNRKVYDAAAYIQAIVSKNEFETITQMMSSAKKRNGTLKP